MKRPLGTKPRSSSAFFLVTKGLRRREMTEARSISATTPFTSHTGERAGSRVALGSLDPVLSAGPAEMADP